MRKCFLLVGLLFVLDSSYGQSKYVGDNLLSILGLNRDSSAVYKEFAKEWGIGKKTSASEKGFKISKNPQTNEVTALLFANKGYEMGDVKFQKYILPIPFGITMDDSYETIRTKLGSPKKEDELVSKFSKDGLTIIFNFKNSSKSKIDFIKIAEGFGSTPIAPITPDEKKGVDKKAGAQISAPKMVKAIPSPIETTPAVFEKSSSNSFESKVAGNNSDIVKTSFYKTIMDVMESGVESYFRSIQSGIEVPVANFWNYKHTYKTNVVIPGTSYNFIYAFPFANSQKDWVAVIKEGVYDDSFKKIYEENLAKLKKDFPQSEGWKYSNPTDGSINAPLKDFEVQNNKFGSVILDYQQNPMGKSVLYFRMILYYD